MRWCRINKDLYNEIKSFLENNSIAEASRRFLVNENYVAKIKRSENYEEFFAHRRDKWFNQPYCELAGKYDTSFNNEWYFEPDNLIKIKEELGWDTHTEKHI